LPTQNSNDYKNIILRREVLPRLLLIVLLHKIQILKSARINDIATGLKIVFLTQTLFMEKNKGLADTQEGEFVLNESGTTVSTDPVEGIDIPASDEPEVDVKKDNEPETANTGK